MPGGKSSAKYLNPEVRCYSVKNISVRLISIVIGGTGEGPLHASSRRNRLFVHEVEYILVSSRESGRSRIHTGVY